MSTLDDARMPSLKDKILAQEAEQKKIAEKKVSSKKEKKVEKLKGKKGK